MIFSLSSILLRSVFFSARNMSLVVSGQTLNAAPSLDKNQLYSAGSAFWNVRGRSQIFTVIPIQTQMSIIQLSRGEFLIIDTVQMNDHLRQESDRLTNNGKILKRLLVHIHFIHYSFLLFIKYIQK
jgi:hypothetical protein